MPSNLLSDRKVTNAKPKEKEYLLSDGAGLSLRVRPDGSRLWIFRYTSPAGKPAKKSLGPYPNVSLGDARRKADGLRKGLIDGRDPASKVEGTPVTAEDLYEIWMRDYVKVNRNAQGAYAAERRMKKHWLPAVGRDRLASITKARILDVLAPIVAAGHKPQANCVLIDVKHMFSYAEVRGWVTSNPGVLIRKSDVGGKDVVRNRVLSSAEIVTLRDKLAIPSGMTVSAHAGYWIALSTMARAGEIASVEDFDIDWDAKEWNLPAAKNKSARDHIIHLSDFAVYWLKVMRDQHRSGSYLFPGKTGVGHLTYKAFAHQATQRQESGNQLQGKTVRGVLSLPGGRWTVHDLRRTGATILGEMGIAENVVEKCLNHAEQSSLVKVYQRQKLLPQRREAFDMLGAHLTKLLGPPKSWGPDRSESGSNVVNLRRA